MTEQKPLIIEDSLVSVPVREEAQRAFEAWFRDPERLASLDAVLAPFGLSVHRNVAAPILERLVFDGDGRYLEAAPE